MRTIVRLGSIARATFALMQSLECNENPSNDASCGKGQSRCAVVSVAVIRPKHLVKLVTFSMKSTNLNNEIDIFYQIADRSKILTNISVYKVMS